MFRLLCVLFLIFRTYIHAAPTIITPTTATAVALTTTLTTSENGNQIPFDNVNIKYFGRWYATGTGMETTWPGAYFKTTLEGASIVQLNLNGPATVYVQVDSGPFRRLQAGEQGILSIPLNATPAALDQGIHDLTVAVANTTLPLPGLNLASLTLDSDGRTAPPRHASSQLVEFIGHDLVLGTGTSNGLVTSFAWQVADALHVEHAQIAFPGASLVDKKSLGHQGMQSYYFQDKEDARQAPAVAVLLLGENDVDSSEETYSSSLADFLKRIRDTTPAVAILVLSEPLGDKTRASQDAVRLRNQQEGDQEVHFIDTTGWLQYGPEAFLDSASCLFHSI